MNKSIYNEYWPSQKYMEVFTNESISVFVQSKVHEGVPE